jgi:hypothetical protein
MAEDTSEVKKILNEDKDNVVDRMEIERIFRIHLDRIPSEEEIARFEGIKESEWKIIEDYIKIEENKNSLESDKLLNEEKGQIDAMKIGGDLANKEMKIKGDQGLDSLKNVAAIPGMAGPMAGMPSIVPPVPERPVMSGMGGPGPGNASPPAKNNKYIRDGRFVLVKFED